MESGDGVLERCVQLVVIAWQGVGTIMVDEFHDRVEVGLRIHEAILAVPVVDLDEFIAASLPRAQKWRNTSLLRTYQVSRS